MSPPRCGDDSGRRKTRKHPFHLRVMAGIPPHGHRLAATRSTRYADRNPNANHTTMRVLHRILCARVAACAAALSSALLVACGGGSDSVSTPSTSTTTPPSTVSVTLNWTAPTQNDDGSSLADLAGYKILYGQDANNLSQTITVSDPAATTRKVDGLAAGTWHFVIAAYNQAGATSDRSNVATVTK